MINSVEVKMDGAGIGLGRVDEYLDSVSAVWKIMDVQRRYYVVVFCWDRQTKGC